MLHIIDIKTALLEKDNLINKVKNYKWNGKKYFDNDDIKDLKRLFKELEESAKCETEVQELIHTLALEGIQFYQTEVS